MASSQTGPYGSTYQGQVWDPNVGGYVAPKTGAQTYDQQSPYQQGAPSPAAAGNALQTASGYSGATGADFSVDPYGNTQYGNTSEQQRKTAAQQQAFADA